MKTYIPSQDELNRKWYIIDAAHQVVGHIATEVAKRLRGKHRPDFTPHLDIGDAIVIINSDKVVLTGKKWSQKKYYRYSGYVGNLKEKNAEKMHSENPAFVLETAIAGMIPHTRLKKDILKRLKVYAGTEHPHTAQQPETLVIS
ncbi:MAG: 50S ribosomal protein L13 [Candidatus Peregrinibacteria bacterium]